MATTLLEAARRLGIKTEAQDKTAPTALTPEQLEEGKKGYEKFIEDQKNNMPWYGKVENAIGDVFSSISIWANTQLFGSGINPWADKAEKTKELPDAMSPEKPSADWSDEERNTFGYLYTQDANEAAKYAIRIYNKYNAEEQKILDKVSETRAKETPVLGSIASVALAPTSIVGMLGTARDYAISKKYGETVKSADYVSALNHQSTRGAIANQLNTSGTMPDDLWMIGGKGWGDVYSLGMSIADSFYLGAGTITGAGMLLNRATYFSRSATEGYNNAISRGLSPDAAGLYGVIIGAIECLTESVSDKLLANVGKDQAKGLLGEILRQTGQEGAEEFVSALVDVLAQEGLFGENSDRQRLIKYYMSEFGMSHEEASKRALDTLAGEIVFAGLSGAVSGGLSAGAAGGIKTAWNKSSVNPLNQTATKELAPKQTEMFEAGKALDDGIAARATIDKLAAKKDSGKELSGYELRKLQSAVSEGRTESIKNNVKLAIVDRLKSKGVKTEDVPALTKIILSKALGEKLTKAQEIKLKNNQIATAISNEMDAKNMLSGNFDSQWAVDAGINKIRDVSGTIKEALAEANEKDVAEDGTTPLNISTEAREALRGKFTGLNSAYTPQSENTHIHTDEIKSTTLNAKQTAQIRAIEKVANALGVDFYIYESEYSKKDGRKYVDKDGNVITDSGYYDPKDGSIHIDLHAGQNGEGTMIYTASHELVHWIKKSAADQFEALKDFVLESLKKEGVQIETLIEKQINKAKENGRDMDRDGAIEEIVADACMTVLTTDAGIKAVTNLKTENKGLWNALKRFFTQFFNRIDRMYKGVKVDSEEGQYLADMHETAKKLRDLFVEGASKSVEANKTQNVTSDFAQVDTKSESVAPIMHSYRTWTESEYVTQRKATIERIAAALSIPKTKVARYINDVNSIAKMIADDRARLDYEASSFGSAFVSNVEYGGSFDYTTLCKKRRIYTGTFSEIQKRLGDVALTPDDILEIRNLMIAEGIEATCGLCYVEGSRANMGKFAKEFIRLYKRDNPDAWIPTMVDVNTPDGVEQMRINHPDAYEQYEYFWNHYGKLKDSDPALFASQQKPKLYEARKEYKGEILKHFKGDMTVAKKNLNGGIRMQSFSDFEIVHLIDTMQVIMDMSTVGLAGQAYTKVPEFAQAFGGTGLKINLSLIAKGVDADGDLIFDDREGMPAKTAFELRDKYSENVGTIIVAFTDEQIFAAMADERIDFIIPFHRSQWKKGQYGAMGLPQGTKDYTNVQNEKLIKPTYHEYRGRMVKDKATNYMPNEYWDFSKSGKENAEAYLEMCAKNNKRPKFYKFLDYDGNGKYSLKADGSTDGYWKLLIDFKMYDNNGVGSPQRPVLPDFNMDESIKMLNEYRGGHSSYPVANSVVDKFVESYNGKNEIKHSGRKGYSEYDKPITIADVDALRDILNKHGVERVSVNEFDSDDIVAAQKWAYKFYKELGVKSPFFRAWFGDWREFDDKTQINIVKQQGNTTFAAGKSKNEDVNEIISWGQTLRSETFIHSAGAKAATKGIYDIEAIIKGALYLDTLISNPSSKSKMPNTAFMHSFYTLYETQNGEFHLLKLFVEEALANNEKTIFKRAYELKDVKKVANIPRSVLSTSGGLTDGTSATTISISDLFALVKQYDKDFSPKSANTMLLDENKQPRVFYHGTDAKFDEFSPDEIAAREGSFFFAENKEDAKAYGNNVYEVYLKAENLADYDNQPSEFYKLKTKREQVEWLKNKGYDGWYADIDSGGWGEFSVFSPEQIKSATSNIGTFDSSDRNIKHSARKKRTVTLSVGEEAKFRANHTRSKVYSKSNMYRIIEKFASKGELTGKTVDELADDMWVSFNTATSVEERREFAHSTAQFVVSKLLQESTSESKEAKAATEQLLYLKGGIRRIEFTDGEITEIRHKKDESGLKSIRARWGYQKSRTNAKVRPYPLDLFVTDVAREVPGMEYLADMNTIDAFFEIADLYDSLKATAKDKWVSNYAETSNSDLDMLQMEIEQTIFEAYETEGEQSKFSKFVASKIDSYKERAEYWKAAYGNFKDRARLENLVVYKAQKMEDLKKGTFLNATQYGNADAFKDSIEKLSSLKFRGTIRKPNTVRDIFKPILAWYTKENPMLIDPNADEVSPHKYSYEVAAMLEVIANGKDGLSTDELAAIYEIMNYFTKFIETYNKVWRNGKWEDAVDIATTDIEIMRHVAKSNTMSAIKRAANKYAEAFSEPMFVARMSDGYQNGFYTQTMTELREAAMKAAVAEMEVREDYDKFIAEHPKYVEEASKEMVDFKGVQIPKIHLISLYMTYHRKHAQAGLIFNGFKFTVKPTKATEQERTVAVLGAVAKGEDISQEEFNALVQMETTLIRSKLNATDKEYIKMLEGLYNGQLRALKVQRDMDRLGFTNATLDYYYPIRRATIAKSIDTTVFEDVNRATNSSFNKNTVKGARQQLFIESADTLINKHIHEICNYAYMSGAIENYNVIYNLDISGNPNNPVSVRTTVESTNLWRSSQEYFRKLVKDMQGIRSGDDKLFNEIVGKLRGGYVQFQLGLNLKTIASQASSIFAATSVLDYSSIVKGLNVDATGVDDYCAYAKLRNYDRSAYKAMGVMERINEKTKWTTAGIDAMDRFIVTKLFGACQVQAEKNGAGKIGTEANKIAAGKLLEKVILDTQSNSLSTERSAMMRNQHEIAKMLTMFTADSMKVATRIFESVGEYRMLKANNASAAEINGAKVKIAKSVASLVMVSAFLATLAQLFRWIYNKEEDEERVPLNVAIDFAGNLLSGIPLLSDLWDYFIDGYEPSSMPLDVVFTLFGGVNNITKDLYSAVFDEEKDKPSSQQIWRDLRTLLYGVGQFMGVPVRNVYNLLTGVIGNASSEAEYRIDDFFYENNYYSDLKEAIEKDDMQKVNLLFSLAYGKQFGNSVSDATIAELNRLAKVSKDYRVLPKTIPDTITRDGVEIELTDNQKQDILTEYEKVNAAIDKLISLNSYKSLSDEKKVERLKYYYSKYFDLAVTKALKLAKSNEQLMYSTVGFDTYAKVYFATKNIKSDTDKNGNVIAGSKKEKVVKAINKLNLSEEKRLLLIASKGYALTESEQSKLVKYINSLKLTATDKAALAKMCDFEVKNGKIVNK